MDGVKLEDRKLSSVKAAISSYGQRIVQVDTTMHKSQENYSKKVYSKTRERHGESKKFIDEAELELSVAKMTVKDLTLRIEESNSRRKADIRAVRELNGGSRMRYSENSRYDKVMEELRTMIQEVNNLKLDMASIMEEKNRAEKEKEDSLSKMRSCSSLLEELDRKIEEINEEQVLVELAKLEAIVESKEIQAWRRENKEKATSALEDNWKKRRDMIQEIEDAKRLETELATVMVDIDILEREIEKFKEMDKEVARKQAEIQVDSDLQQEENADLVSLLDSVTKEVEDTKKALIPVKEKSFQLMTSMDIIREKRKHVAEETAHAKNKEDKVNMAVLNLNSKLLRAKVELEALRLYYIR